MFIVRIYNSKVPACFLLTLFSSSHLVHMIPKPSEESGLVIGWPTQQPDQEALQKVSIDAKYTVAMQKSY